MAAVAALMMPFAVAMAPPASNIGAVSFIACTDISPRGQRLIVTLADVLNSPQLGKRRFTITGHAEAMGDKDKEQAASRARAELVQRELMMRGVDTSRLTIRAAGASEPLDDILPQDMENCRVEVVVTD
jgi:outer membrane protein OmpA-like peptidoglycan-associated protein